MRAPGLVVHEGRNSLVADALPASILFAASAWLVAKTLAGPCAEVVEGQAESRVQTAFWPESRSSWFRYGPAGSLNLRTRQLLSLAELGLRVTCLAL